MNPEAEQDEPLLIPGIDPLDEHVSLLGHAFEASTGRHHILLLTTPSNNSNANSHSSSTNGNKQTKRSTGILIHRWREADGCIFSQTPAHDQTALFERIEHWLDADGKVIFKAAASNKEYVFLYRAGLVASEHSSKGGQIEPRTEVGFTITIADLITPGDVSVFDGIEYRSVDGIRVQYAPLWPMQNGSIIVWPDGLVSIHSSDADSVSSSVWLSTSFGRGRRLRALQREEGIMADTHLAAVRDAERQRMDMLCERLYRDETDSDVDGGEYDWNLQDYLDLASYIGLGIGLNHEYDNDTAISHPRWDNKWSRSNSDADSDGLKSTTDHLVADTNLLDCDVEGLMTSGVLASPMTIGERLRWEKLLALCKGFIRPERKPAHVCVRVDWASEPNIIRKMTEIIPSVADDVIQRSLTKHSLSLDLFPLVSVMEWSLIFPILTQHPDELESFSYHARFTLPLLVATSVHGTSETAKGSQSVSFNTPEQLLQGQTDQKECCICITDPAIIAFFPCSHLCVCLDCSTKLAKCPVCREKIESKMRIFLASSLI